MRVPTLLMLDINYKCYLKFILFIYFKFVKFKNVAGFSSYASRYMHKTPFKSWSERSELKMLNIKTQNGDNTSFLSLKTPFKD